jgi:Flp pilus assembly pilin Flp
MERPMIARALRAADWLAGNDDGQDLVEYGLLIGLIALAAVVAVASLGTTINTVFWQTIAAQSF